MELVVDVFEKGTRYWLVRTNSGKWYEDFSDENFIAIDSSFIFFEKDDIYKSVDEVKEKIENELSRIILNNELKSNYTKEELDIKPQSITIQANRIIDFVNKMRPGDFVLIPSESSMEFKVGIIESNPEDINTHIPYRNLLKSELNNKYKSPRNLISRKVRWIKTVSRKDIPTNLLSSFITNHKAIWSLDENKYYFQSIINPIFIDEDNKLNLVIKIDKKSGLNVSEWSSLYTLFSQIETELDIKFEEVKSNVQSPGWIAIVDNLINSTSWTTLVLILYKYFDKHPIEINSFIKRKFTESGKQEEKLELSNYEIQIKRNELEMLRINKEIARELETDTKAVIQDDQSVDQSSNK